MIAEINGELCVGCGLCADVCPADAIELNGKAVIRQDKCMGCGACINECSQNAIILVEIDESN